MKSNEISPRAFSISDFCRRYGIGRTNAYHEIAAGRLRAVKVGRRTLISHDAAEAWLAALPELAEQIAPTEPQQIIPKIRVARIRHNVPDQ